MGFLYVLKPLVGASGVRDFETISFQIRTEPSRRNTNFCFKPSSVKDGLAVLQRRTEVELPAETRIILSLFWG
jgi:hypothetical protein